jgi:hypothetical protein
MDEDRLKDALASVRKPSREGETKNRIRPCITEAIKRPLHGHGGHLVRLAIANEYLARGPFG